MMATSHANRHASPSPPLASSAYHQSTNKRDRKRTQIENRVKDIAATLTVNRDVNLRTQLNSIQRDIAFIGRAQLYTGRRLDDHPEDLVTEIANVNALGVIEGEPAKLPLGRHAARFVERVNNAMDERDGNIANIHRHFLIKLETAKREMDFAVEVANAEEEALKETARLRVIASLQARKRALQKDREVLDSADTNAMLHGAGITLTVPGSPGGLHSNRKTRHGRHTRQEQENLEQLEGGKRKRKQDFDESPGPGSRGFMGMTPWDKTRDTSTAGDTDISKHFTNKELATHYRAAQILAAESWIERRSIQAQNGILSSLINGHHENGRAQNGHHDPAEDDEIDTTALVAPAMDRTGSHATRSTRNNQIDVTSARDANEALKNPGRTYGLAVMEALGPKQTKVAKGDLEAPWTSSLTAAEILEDRAFLDTLS